MRSLILCQTCKRHVKGSDAACPFCGSAVHAANREISARARGFSGGRAALFLAGTTAFVPGCTEETAPDDDDTDAGDASAPDGGHDAGPMAVPVYGIAIDSGLVAVPYGIAIPLDAGTPDAAQDASCPQFGNLPVPVYGVPVDSGPPSNDCTDAGPVTDAGKDGGHLVVPVYGGPIPRDR